MTSAEKTYPLAADDRSRIQERLGAALADERQVAFAYLLGSVLDRVRVHDVDIGVFLRPDDETAAADYALGLGGRLSAELAIPVDVRVLNAAPVSFLFHALRGALIVSHDDELLAAMIERTASRYLDAAPVLRRATKEAFAP